MSSPYQNNEFSSFQSDCEHDKVISSNPSLKIDIDQSTSSTQFFNNSNLYCFSTQNSQDSKLKNQGKQSRVKTLTAKDTFACRCTQNQHLKMESQAQLNAIQQKCKICDGRKQINGENYYAKFFEYVLEFKLGIKQSYQSKNSKHISPKLIDSCQEAYQRHSDFKRNSISSFGNGRSSISSQIKSITHSSIIQKCNEVKYVHQGYECDICGMLPIVGSRHHCLVCEDYDACSNCMQKEGHQHRMKEYKTSGVHSQIAGAISIMQKSAKLHSINACLTTSCRPGFKVYSSSIR